jgi:DNA repair protein RecN (Recombination protein N)
VIEIARMLGGDADREVSRAHARELLARGEEEAMETVDRTPTPARQRRGKPV